MSTAARPFDADPGDADGPGGHDGAAPDDLRRALDAGHEALERALENLIMATREFDTAAPALALLLAVRGRVVVTGLGKSGHVGRKLAATLASTGTPAFFVHAGDALHGDAGMVTADDLLLVI